MQENERLYPISEAVFNQKVLPIIRASPQSIPLPGVLRYTLYPKNRLSLAGLA
jgi:hypothetical protein